MLICAVGDFAQIANAGHQQHQARKHEQYEAKVRGFGIIAGEPGKQAARLRNLIDVKLLNEVDSVGGLAGPQALRSHSDRQPETGNRRQPDHRPQKAKHPAKQLGVGELVSKRQRSQRVASIESRRLVQARGFGQRIFWRTLSVTVVAVLRDDTARIFALRPRGCGESRRFRHVCKPTC